MKKFKEVLQKETSGALTVQQIMERSKYFYTFDPSLHLLTKWDSEQTYKHFKDVLERGMSSFTKARSSDIMGQFDMYLENGYTDEDFYHKLAVDVIEFDKKPPVTMSDIDHNRGDMLFNTYKKSMVIDISRHSRRST